MNTTPEKHTLGIIALVFGCLSIIAAVLPTWVLPLVLPPEPIGKVLVERPLTIKDRGVVNAKVVESQAPAQKTDWYSICSAAVVTLSVLALVLAAISYVTHEPRRFAAAAGFLGVGAIIFQFSLLIAGALIVILFIYVILNALDISS
jgi:hypothetical protein